MRAREPDDEGFVECDGLKLHYERHGTGGPTILLMPSWTIVHAQTWKMQVPYLARHHRVVLYDGPGNGRSDRPLQPAAYHHTNQVGYALRVLDAPGTDRALVCGLSMAARWVLELAADHPERVLGIMTIAGAIPLRDAGPDTDAEDAFLAAPPDLPPSRVPELGQDPPAHWAKWNRRYWLEHFDDFAAFFFGQCFSEPHSTKAIEDAVGWAGETTPEVLLAEAAWPAPGYNDIARWSARLRCPALHVHGSDDRIVPLPVAEELARLTGGRLVVLEGAGHVPVAGDPVRSNVLIHEFAERLRAPRPLRETWTRWTGRPRRVLYLSSPIGLGHARRDLAIAQELRRQAPGVEVDWLAQHPVSRALGHAGERVHPASRWLSSESAHIDSEATEHDLHCFQALRRMDEILVANFMLFQDVVQERAYDLVIADEAWEVDHFLYENPELKRFQYAWMTDFVGHLPMPDGGRREELLAADYNAEMLEHVARYPRLRDRAVFVGDPQDIVPDRFGTQLPHIRDWAQANYTFAGYVTGFDPAPYCDRAALRERLGYRPDEQVCVVTVGGSGVGTHLLRKVRDAYPTIARRVPGLRMVLVTGPRIDPASLPAAPGLEVLGYVPDLQQHLAASDLAIVQAGLTTCMELTACGRPFVYIPLRHHYEQNFHVPHRLRRYRAGRRLDYDDITPDRLAAVVAAEIGTAPQYRPVATDGAARAAALLAELL
ncbi:alpha/beta fold hydrolase [Dactylosporangium sp. NPDC051541]|uniref:alpha/beta fold hydrolase n=1 Tax=Dactylosporangium sp. NPDC051541 TaxID=3363977 RepID=UPI0037ACAE24